MPQGDVVADGAGHHAGILPDPGGAGSPPREIEAGQVGPIDQDPAGAGALETHHQAQGRGFPASRGPGEGHHTALRHVEGQSGDGGGGGSRPGEGDLVEGQSRPRGKATAAGFVSQFDQVEGGVRGGHAVGGVVEVNPHLPHRQEGLGREDQHEQGGFEGHLAAGEPESHGHRHERHRQRRQQLQSERGQEGGVENLDGLAAELFLRDFQAPALGPGACEGLEGRQALDEVGEVVGQFVGAREGAAGRGLRGPADQGHEDGHQRQRERDDEGARPVGQQQHPTDQEGHARRQAELRQIFGEVAVQRVEAGGGDLRQRRG